MERVESATVAQLNSILPKLAEMVQELRRGYKSSLDDFMDAWLSVAHLYPKDHLLHEAVAGLEDLRKYSVKEWALPPFREASRVTINKVVVACKFKVEE